MLSGIEAASLALALLPLFVSAAEHYCEGVDTLKRLRSKDTNNRISEFFSDIRCEMYEDLAIN